MWSATLKITNKGSLYSKKISIEEVQGKLNKNFKDIKTTIKLKNNILPLNIFLRLSRRTKQKRNKGYYITSTSRRYRGTFDNWVWSSYSPERLHLRTKVIFKEAMIGYREMVETLFPSIKNRLER